MGEAPRMVDLQAGPAFLGLDRRGKFFKPGKIPVAIAADGARRSAAGQSDACVFNHHQGRPASGHQPVMIEQQGRLILSGNQSAWR